MKKVTFKFPSAQFLWQYKQSIESHSIEANMHDLTLSCVCSDAEIELAMNRFNAKILHSDSSIKLDKL